MVFSVLEWRTICLVLTIGIQLAGCNPERSNRHYSPDPAVLRIGNGTEPQTLDPHRAEGVPAANILRDLYEGLVSEAPDGQLIPGVAEHWDISEDGKQYRFYLRDNARWSNGDKLTAEDFVYSFRRSIDPKTGSSYSNVLSCIDQVEAIIRGDAPLSTLGVKALDQRTLLIQLKAATPYFLSLLTHSTTYPVHRQSVERWSGQFSRPGRLISNGAYVLDDWVIQSTITLKKNSRYWNADHTRIDTVVYHAIDDPSQELQRYWANELDWTASIPVGQVEWAKHKFGSQLQISPYLGTYYYALNVSRPPFKDQSGLRLALSMAIDRELIVDKITAAGELPAYHWVPPGVLNYQSKSSIDTALSPVQRLEKAKRLYYQAGYSEDNPLRVKLLYNTSDNHKRIALAIAAMWRKTLGVETELINQEWKVFLSQRKQLDQTQVVRSGWIADYNDAWSFLELFQSDHGMNFTGYNNPEYDALLSKAAIENSQTERQRVLQQAENLLLHDEPVIPVFFYVSKSLVKPWVQGFAANVMDHHYSKDLRISKAGHLPEPE